MEIFKSGHESDFGQNVDEDTLKKIGKTRSYVTKTSKGEVLFSFHCIDQTRVVVLASDERCLIKTNSQEIIDLAEDIKEDTGKRELFMLFLSIAERDSEKLEELEDHILALEDKLIETNHPDNDGAQKILEYRRKVLANKRYYNQLETIVDELSGIDSYFDFIDKRIGRIYESILRMQEYLEQVREAYQSQIDIEQNSLMKFFTVATTILMPLTLITGWYGMNLIIPEFRWRYGYIGVISLCVAVVCIMVYIFKKKKWL